MHACRFSVPALCAGPNADEGYIVAVSPPRLCAAATGAFVYPYWLLFTVWTAGAIQTNRQGSRQAQLIFFVAASVLTMLMIGLRFEVGGDWGQYQRIYDYIFFLDLPAALAMTDPGYGLLNWVGAQTGLGITFVNLACAALFTVGLARLAWNQPNPALSMLVAVPYLIIVVAMGYTRQAAAIGLICLAIADASERRLARLVILILIAALFHKTAILILPMALIPVFRRSFLLGAVGAIAFLIIAILVLGNASDNLLNNYVRGNYDSQGAAIRVAMNVVAAALFLAFHKRIVMPSFQKSYWVTCSIFAILSIPAFALSSASSGVDRISLYLIPLQIATYSRLPLILGETTTALPSIVIGVIGYSFLVQFVWLNYADNAMYWLPYSMFL